MKFDELTGVTKLDEFEAKDAYLAACDLKAYLDMLVEKTHDKTLYPIDFANAFNAIEDAYDATGDPHLTPKLAKQLINGLNKARQNKAFAMDEDQLDFDLTCIKPAL